MANETELEKIDRAAEYFERYFEFEDAVTVSKENKEYLKTYIHDNDYVVKNFNIKNKIIKSLGISIGIGLAAFLLLWLLLGTKLIIGWHYCRCTYFYRCRRFRYRTEQIQTYCC